MLNVLGEDAWDDDGEDNRFDQNMGVNESDEGRGRSRTPRPRSEWIEHTVDTLPSLTNISTIANPF